MTGSGGARWIDTLRKQTSASLTASVLLVLPICVSAQDATPPDAPDGLRAEVYSGTAIELFWQRASDDEGVRAYEIARDGDVVVTRDAASYFDDTLAAGTDYGYSIVALDAVGNRSAPATLSVSTRRGAPDAATVPPPAGLRLSVYSSTAAELFWNRAPSSSGVVRTEVRRDGAPIGSTDGTSFFDDTRTPGRAGRYELVAFDAAGTASPTSVLDPTAGDEVREEVGEEVGEEVVPVSSPLIREDSWQRLLAEVVALIDGVPLEALRREVDRSNSAGAATPVGAVLPDTGLVVTGNTELGTNEARLQLDCPGGGTAVASVSNDIVRRNDWRFDACELNGERRDGGYLFTNFGGREGGGRTLFDGYAVDRPDGYRLRFDGLRETDADRVGYLVRRAWSDTDVDRRFGGDRLIVQRYGMVNEKRTGIFNAGPFRYVLQSDGSYAEAQPVEFRATLRGGFAVTAAWTEERQVTVSVNLRYDGDYVRGGGELEGSGRTVLATLAPRDDAFPRPFTLTAQDDVEAARWNAGEIVVSVSDGSSLRLGPATDDFATFYLSLNGGEPFLWPWTPALTPVCFGPFGGCTGASAVLR